MQTTGTCAHCATSIPPTGKRCRPKKYCSDACCRAAYNAAHPGKHRAIPGPHTCEDCGGEYTGRKAKRCPLCRESHRVYEPKPLVEHQCERCGECFAAMNHPNIRFCSARCRGKSRATMTKPCVICGAPFEFTHNNRRRKCCASCSGFARATLGASCSVPWASCVHCRSVFVARGSKGTHCRATSVDGGGRDNYYKPIPKQWLNCAECGKEFLGHAKKHRFCCKAHAKTAMNRARRHVERAAGKRDAYKRRRSQLERTRRSGRAFTLREVAIRDGWRCHICGRKVRRDEASIDHLVPLSHGGEHSLLNVALAHVRCNGIRSDRGQAQLRLLG